MFYFLGPMFLLNCTYKEWRSGRDSGQKNLADLKRKLFIDSNRINKSAYFFN